MHSPSLVNPKRAYPPFVHWLADVGGASVTTTSPEDTADWKNAVGLEQSCGSLNPLAANVSNPDPAGPLSTTVILKYGKPPVEVPAKVALLPLTARQLTDVNTL